MTDATITAAELADAIKQGWPVMEPFGPNYPSLPGLARWKRRADLSTADRDAYGREVLRQIRALQARELARAETPITRPKCASGTWESDGDKILAAIRRANGGGDYWKDTKPAPKPARIEAPALPSPEITPEPAPEIAAPVITVAMLLAPRAPAEPASAPEPCPGPVIAPEPAEARHAAPDEAREAAAPEIAAKPARPRRARAPRQPAPVWQPFTPARAAPAFIPAGRATRYGIGHGLR